MLTDFITINAFPVIRYSAHSARKLLRGVCVRTEHIN